MLLEPVAKELVVVRPIGFEPLRWVRALAAEDPVPSAKQLTSAAVSLPGVLLTQIAAIRTLARQGMDLQATPPVAVVGHSQGILAVEALKAAGATRQGAAGPRTADRRRRHAGGPPPRHLGPRRSPADGVGQQRRPGAHLPAARRVLPRRPDRAAARVVDPQRPALGRHHRHPRAAVPLRAVLQADLGEGGSRPQEQDPRRRRLRAGLRPGAGRGGLPHATAGRRYRHRRRLGGEGRPRCRIGPRDGRVHPGTAGRLGGRGRRGSTRQAPAGFSTWAPATS